jgi:hypothetical protein
MLRIYEIEVRKISCLFSDTYGLKRMLNRLSFFAFLPFVLLSLLAFGTATLIGACIAGILGVAALLPLVVAPPSKKR